MEVSVIIPSHARTEKLRACLRALAGQTLGHGRYEVLVGFDGGGDEGAARAAWRVASPTAPDDSLKTVSCAKVGQASVRNQLLPLARGGTLVFLNDDMVPERGFLEAHLAAQREREAAGGPALVVGDSPWRIHEPDRLFDRLVRETSMVFFYSRMKAELASGRAGPDHDWGFRHAWMLNLSVPASAVREVGGLSVFPSTYGFEDDDLAFRLGERLGMPVLFRPGAVAVHDHRMEPRQYLERERNLGFAAWGFAGAAPRCAGAMFGRDIRSREEIEYSRAFVERERAAAERLEQSFMSLADVPAAAITGAEAPRVINLIYEQHLLLKRYWWRKGLLAAAAQEPVMTAEAKRVGLLAARV